MLRIKVWHMKNAMFETGPLYFLAEFLGVQFRRGEYVSASEYRPGGPNLLADMDRGGPYPRGVQICCDTGSSHYFLFAFMNLKHF